MRSGLPPSKRTRRLPGKAKSPESWSTGDGSKPARTGREPILDLFIEWRRRHRDASRLSRKWQRLEAQLVKAIGFPHVSSISRHSDLPAKAFSHDQIDDLFADHPSQASLHSELDKCLVHWESEQNKVGLDAVRAEEYEAWDQEHAAANAVFRTRASTLTGVEAKLAVLLKLAITGSSDPKFPWPQLKSVLLDVRRLRVGNISDSRRRSTAE